MKPRAIAARKPPRSPTRTSAADALAFLQAELAHAQHHLARTRHLQALTQQRLQATGLDELHVYEHLATNKAYRQLQRDEIFYQQMWLRLQRHLERYKPTTQAAGIETASPKPEPIRHTAPLPGRNSLCPCGSTLKIQALLRPPTAHRE